MSSGRHALKSIFGFIAESAGFLEDAASSARIAMRGISHHAQGFGDTAQVRAKINVLEACDELRTDHPDAIKRNPKLGAALKALES